MHFTRIRSLVGLLAGTICCASAATAAAQQPNPTNLAPSNTIAAQDWLFRADSNAYLGLASAYRPEQVGTHWIGAEVTPADPTLRSQLGLGDGQGLVVSWIHQGSPAAQAGLESHDVLVQLADSSLG